MPNAVLRMKADQHMDVVFVIAHLFNLQVVPLFNATDGRGNAPRHGRAEQSFAVCDRKDQVVMGAVDAMIRSSDGHPSMVQMKGTSWFPSNIPPLQGPRGKPRGKGWNVYFST